MSIEYITLEEFQRTYKATATPKRGKYNNIRVEDDSYTFDSKAEHRRYLQLKLLQAGGAISGLRVHPRYKLPQCTYVGDFEYTEENHLVCEDVKGAMTAIFKLKAKLFREQYPDIELKITKAR